MLQISRNSVLFELFPRLGRVIKTRLVAKIKSGAKSISQEFQPPKVSEEKNSPSITAVGQNFIAKKIHNPIIEREARVNKCSIACLSS